jgi:hypothetical protein
MAYLRAMGQEAAAEVQSAPSPPAGPALLDVRASDFVARINQPALDWFPFWLGAAGGLFVGWLIFRAASGSKQLEQIQQAAMQKMFGTDAGGGA